MDPTPVMNAYLDPARVGSDCPVLMYVKNGGQFIEMLKPPAKHFNLIDLYEMLQCELVEFIRLRHRRLLICDEEFLLRHHPQANPAATYVLHHGNQAHFKARTILHGRVLVCPSRMVK
jgi:hypothetical protein